MSQAEGRMWWYRALHANVRLYLGDPAGARLLDAGCGTGGLLAALGGPAAVGLDRAPLALALAREKSGAALVCGSVDALPFPDRSFDLMVSADVLYHRAVDEGRALAEAFRCLRPGGALVVNVPAYQWLTGAHDRAVHGARRYTAGRLRAALARAGFRVARLGYWNTLPFPLMAARRKLFTGGDGSDVVEYPAAVEFAFNTMMRIERAALRAGLDLPFGGSVIARAERP